MPSQPLAEQGAAPQPSPDQMPFAAGLGGAQEGDISAQTLFLPLEGVAGSCLSLPQQQGLGWALQLSTAKSSWMISDPASRFQRSGVQDCKPSAAPAEQRASACAWLQGQALTGVIHVLSTWEDASPGYCHCIHHGLRLNLVNNQMPLFLSLCLHIKLSLTFFFSFFFPLVFCCLSQPAR